MNKKIIKYLSYLFVLASFYFIFLTFKKVQLHDISFILSFQWLFFLLIFSLLYAFLNFIRAFNWHTLLYFLSEKKIVWKQIYSIYFKTEIAKYIPSNVLHFASRHILTQKIGFSHTQMVFANFFDMFFVALAAFFLTLIGIFFKALVLPETILQLVNKKFIFILMIIIGLGFGFLIFKYRKKMASYVQTFFKFQKFLIAFKIIFLNWFVFIISAFILFYLFSFLGSFTITMPSFFHLIVGYALAWLAGFIIPGSPGGLGVREACIILLFSPITGEQSALIAGLLLRIITTMGDVWTFFIGSYLQKKSL